MGRVWVLVGVVGTIAACSPNVAEIGDATSSPIDGSAADPDDGAKSGSRLKLTWYQFTDGTKQWSGMYDAQNKEMCSPYYGAWPDGNVYCVPQTGGSLVYTDATCTAKALDYYVDSTCPQDPSRYHLEYADSGCTSVPAHLYLRGVKIAPATTYTKLSNGACSANGAPQAYDAIYALGSEVATSQLVQLSLSVPEGSGRVGQRYYESSDGMRFPWTLHDNTLATDCYTNYSTSTSTTARCVPTDSGFAYYSHDAACTQRELGVQAICEQPSYAYPESFTRCPYEDAPYYTLNAVGSSPLYEATGTSCIAITPSSGFSYYTMGSQVDIPSLTRAVDTSTTHRVQQAHFTTPEGLRYRDPYSLYDSQMATECYPSTLPDGSIRCIADGGYVSTFFANAGCTTPLDVVEVYRGPSGCMAPVPPKYARKSIAPEPGTCSYSTEIHEVGAIRTGAVYAGSPGSCNLYTTFEGTLYSVGPVVPLTDFVGASIAIDTH